MRVRVRERKWHGAFRQYHEGDELDVTAAEFIAFSDKFTVIDAPPDAVSDSSFEDREEFIQRVTFDASNMNISDVLSAVESGHVSAKIALESELSGRNRTTLVVKLKRGL